MPKGKNFTEAEKMVLQALVVQYKHIIESKRTDSFAVQKKKATWNKIASEFNARLKTSQKDATQLKKLWENTKFRNKAERKNVLQRDSRPHSASTSDKSPHINSCSNITTELSHTVDSESLLMEPQTLMFVDDTSQQNADFIMDCEKDGVICSGDRNTNYVKIKREPCSSEIKPEPDSDDGLQNPIVPSLYSLTEYRNPDVTNDACAVDMKTEIKGDTWWRGSISPEKFQPQLSSLLRNQIKNREDEESLYESNASTCKNINEAALVPVLYGWHPTSARIQPIKPKCRSKDVAHAICELRQLQQSVNKHISENQFDIFGRSVASQLKNIRHYRALLAQTQIQALLTNIATETLRSSER